MNGLSRKRKFFLIDSSSDDEPFQTAASPIKQSQTTASISDYESSSDDEPLSVMAQQIRNKTQKPVQVKQEIARVKQEIVQVKQEIVQVKQETAQVKQETAQIKQETAQIKQETAQAKQGTTVPPRRSRRQRRPTKRYQTQSFAAPDSDSDCVEDDRQTKDEEYVANLNESQESQECLNFSDEDFVGRANESQESIKSIDEKSADENGVVDTDGAWKNAKQVKVTRKELELEVLRVDPNQKRNRFLPCVDDARANTQLLRQFPNFVEHAIQSPKQAQMILCVLEAVDREALFREFSELNRFTDNDLRNYKPSYEFVKSKIRGGAEALEELLSELAMICDKDIRTASAKAKFLKYLDQTC